MGLATSQGSRRPLLAPSGHAAQAPEHTAPSKSLPVLGLEFVVIDDFLEAQPEAVLAQ